MRPKLRVFLLLALLIFIAHIIVTYYAVEAFDSNASLPDRFAPSFALALCSLPLMHLWFYNSILVALAVSAIIVFLPPRASILILASIPILLIATMAGAASFLDWRTEHGWMALTPRPITPAPRGTLEVRLPSSVMIGNYLVRELRDTRSPIDPPPQEVDWFLVANRAAIDGLRRELPKTTPNNVDRYLMQRLLLADALQTRAADEIEAARRIADTLLHEPDVGAASLAIAAARQRILVARKLGLPPQPIGFDPHQQLIDAINAQSGIMRELRVPWYAWLYARLCIAESASSALQQARIIRNLRGHAFAMPQAEDPRPRVPWNPLGVARNGRLLAWRANELVSLAAQTSK